MLNTTDRKYGYVLIDKCELCKKKLLTTTQGKELLHHELPSLMSSITASFACLMLSSTKSAWSSLPENDSTKNETSN